MVNFQIPIGKGLKSKGKPSDSYRTRLEIQWQTIRFLYEKGWKSNGKPSDSYIKKWKSNGKPSDSYIKSFKIQW